MFSLPKQTTSQISVASGYPRIQHPQALQQYASHTPPVSPLQAQILQLQQNMGNRAVAQLISQSNSTNQSLAPLRKSHLPANIKGHAEIASGMDLSAVNVYYNSTEPAQLGALAYAKGMDIHLGPKQEQHLPHETWHVVQQMEGRVRPTSLQVNGQNVNDERHLEHEANTMASKLAQNISPPKTTTSTPNPRPTPSFASAPLQPVWDWRKGALAAAGGIAGFLAAPVIGVTGGVALAGMSMYGAYNANQLSNPTPVPRAIPDARTPRQVQDAARGLEERVQHHGGLRILNNVAALDALNQNEVYLWVLRSDGAHGLEIAVARRGNDRIGHPTLSKQDGNYRSLITGGEMRYMGQSAFYSFFSQRGAGWILDNESGRFGRTVNLAQTEDGLRQALAIFQAATGQRAYGDLLSGNEIKRNLQRTRKDYAHRGTNWLSLGYQ